MKNDWRQLGAKAIISLQYIPLEKLISRKKHDVGENAKILEAIFQSLLQGV